MSKDIVIKDSIFRIGRVIAVEGRAIKVDVDKAKNSSHLLFKGELIKNVSVGSYIKITKGFTTIIGKVEGEYVIEDFTPNEKNYSSTKSKINRNLKVSLLGFFNGKKFERGIKEMPLIDNECYLLDREEFAAVHDFIKSGDKPLPLGNLSLEKGLGVSVGIDSLFASHIGIFGNTGSGKSYTLAKIYHELFQKYGNEAKFKAKAKFFLIDFNGEYISPNAIIAAGNKKIYKLSTRADGDRFPVSPETLYDPSFWRVVLEATEKTQAPFLRRAIGNTWMKKRTESAVEIMEFIKSRVLLTFDRKDSALGATIFVEFLSDLENCLPDSNISDTRDLLRQSVIYHNQNKEFYYQDDDHTYYNVNAREAIGRILEDINLDGVELDVLDKLKLQVIFQYYDDIIKGHANKEHLSPLIKRMEKRFDDVKKIIVLDGDLPEQDKNITIVSLKDVNIDMRKILPLLLCKQLYDEQKQKNDPTQYLNIVIDEAHNILSRDSMRESEQWKDYRLETFEEIIKEGRKFGVFLTIASQRPSDISATIISQIHNFFLHRLINNNDIVAVEKTISYLDKVSFEYLPILPTGTCILAGLAAQVPVVIDIGLIAEENEPDNKTMKLIANWQ